MLGKTESMRRRGGQTRGSLNGVIDSVDTSVRKFWEIVKDREARLVVAWDCNEADMTE